MMNWWAQNPQNRLGLPEYYQHNFSDETYRTAMRKSRKVSVTVKYPDDAWRDAQRKLAPLKRYVGHAAHDPCQRTVRAEVDSLQDGGRGDVRVGGTAMYSFEPAAKAGPE